MTLIRDTGIEEILPSKFHLSQNYPNPFTEKTTIKYCLPFKTKVKIEVFNSEGEFVETLIDTERKAGTYEIEFSAKGGSTLGGNTGHLPGGTYFFKITAGVFVSTKKMIIEK